MPSRYLKSSSSEPVVRIGHPLTHQLTGFWPMCEGSGNTLNAAVQRPNQPAGNTSSAGKYTATGTNAPTWTNSPWGPAVSLNGTNQYFTVDNSSGGNDNFINTTTNGGTLLVAICPTGNGGAQGNAYDQPQVVCNS